MRPWTSSNDAAGGEEGSPARAAQRMAGLLRTRSAGRALLPRDLRRVAKVIAAASLAVVLIWGLCLVPISLEHQPDADIRSGRTLLRRSLLGARLTSCQDVAPNCCECAVGKHAARSAKAGAW